MEFNLYTEPTKTVVVDRIMRQAGRIKRKGLNSGLRAAADPILTKMQALVPVRFGALRKSLTRRQLRRGEKSKLGIPWRDAAYIVGPLKKVTDRGYKLVSGEVRASKRISQQFKARWMEYGVKEHVIPKQPKIAKRYVFGRYKGTYLTTIKRPRKPMFLGGKWRTMVVHPGFPPKEFIGPAYRSEAPRSDVRFVEAVLDILEAEE